MMRDGNQSADTGAEAELAALLAALEAERPAFEAWLAKLVADAQRELDALLADLAASGPDLDALLAHLEGDSGASVKA